MVQSDEADILDDVANRDGIEWMRDERSRKDERGSMRVVLEMD